MTKVLISSTRKLLAVVGLKLCRLSDFQVITSDLESTRRDLESTRRDLETTRRDLETTRRDLETTRRELETTRRLLTPVAISYSNPSQASPILKTPPITQIFISETDRAPGSHLQSCIQSVKRCFPGSEHKIYENQEIKDFIHKYYGRELLNDYNKIKPYAYKADLARLCIVNIVGGWYADISVTWTTPLAIPGNISLLAVRDILQNCRSSWGVSNGVFYAQKNHPALSHGIEAIRSNIRSNYYGITPLCPTGPNVWGKAIATTANPSETIFANLLLLTPQHPCKNLAFVDKEGHIFAFFKPSTGGDGLSAFGENVHISSYGDLWHKRDIYIQEQ